MREGGEQVLLGFRILFFLFFLVPSYFIGGRFERSSSLTYIVYLGREEEDELCYIFFEFTSGDSEESTRPLKRTAALEVS